MVRGTYSRQVHVAAGAGRSTTVSKLRLFKESGVLSLEDMRNTEKAIKMQLDIR
jgi:hypothetical protein